jgi:hypothetical protein
VADVVTWLKKAISKRKEKEKKTYVQTIDAEFRVDPSWNSMCSLMIIINLRKQSRKKETITVGW